jgi:hypothetical protein
VPALKLLDLARLVYPTFRWAEHHRRIADALTAVAQGRTRRLLVSTHPQSGKSTLVRLFLSWLLMSDPTRKLLLLSYSKRLAAAHSVAARDMTRRWGPTLFGREHVGIRQDTRARDLWHTTAGGYCLADTAQGAVSGFAGDGCLYDDPYKGAEDSSSERVRETVWQTFASVVETRLSPSGFVVIVSTAWHPEGLPQRLVRSEPQMWHQLVLPALDEQERPLWPERYPLEWYLHRRRQFEERGLSYLWSSLYMCDPREAGGKREFPADWLTDAILYTTLPEDDPVTLTVMAVDPSLGKTAKSDYSAITTARLTKSRVLYVDCDLQRRPITTLEDDVARAFVAVRPQALAIEANGFQQVFAGNVKRKVLAAERTINASIREMAQTFGGGDSKPRVRISLSPLLAQGRLRIANTPGGRLLLEQLREFPGGLHDDGPDSVELATQMINLILTGKRRPEPLVMRA